MTGSSDAAMKYFEAVRNAESELKQSGRVNRFQVTLSAINPYVRWPGGAQLLTTLKYKQNIYVVEQNKLPPSSLNQRNFTLKFQENHDDD